NSPVPGVAHVSASGTVTVGGVAVAVSTSGYGAHDVSNQKTWVDAQIAITESGVNKVGDPHTFTVVVMKNDGTSVSPAEGVTITPSTDFGTISPASTCVSGSTNVVGTAHVTASGEVVVGGVTVHVATNGYGATTVHNVKTWVDARISIG